MASQRRVISSGSRLPRVDRDEVAAADVPVHVSVGEQPFHRPRVQNRRGKLPVVGVDREGAVELLDSSWMSVLNSFPNIREIPPSGDTDSPGRRV